MTECCTSQSAHINPPRLSLIPDTAASAAHVQLRPISEDGGPELAEWNKVMEPFLGMSWLDTPWLYSEFYAYRRVVEAFSFFKTGEERVGVVSPNVGFARKGSASVVVGFVMGGAGEERGREGETSTAESRVLGCQYLRLWKHLTGSIYRSACRCFLVLVV